VSFRVLLSTLQWVSYELWREFRRLRPARFGTSQLLAFAMVAGLGRGLA
jgi:hypothetical protein